HTAKSLSPLPNLYKPLADEARVRQRYVDLIVRPEARRVAIQRVETVRALRHLLDGRGFLEVETPMLQPLHGGATARPFRTHMNAFDLELYLRIAPELYLKRCIVGGLDRVYEINRNFRNEGADRTHNPEFAMLELYEAYSDYDGMAALTRDMVQTGAVAATGSTVVTHADGTELDLGGDWAAITLYGSASEALGEEVTPQTPRATLVGYAERLGLDVAPIWGPGQLVEELFDHLVAPGLQAPTFVRDYPEETSPLTRAHRSTPGLAEKWDLYIRGVETATAYSELTDPVVQRERFLAQATLAAAGDPEAMSVDEDFLVAMEYGMPPTGGMGMGIDRLLMAYTGLGIRETVLFPLVRPL
ncbi:MAG: lysine--tRNA ligase, partial [Geodermatophilaceae bacterium]|nr:lysine--tRNA ligase [Geodermatophilaceae bacterium]